MNFATGSPLIWNMSNVHALTLQSFAQQTCKSVKNWKSCTFDMFFRSVEIPWQNSKIRGPKDPNVWGPHRTPIFWILPRDLRWSEKHVKYTRSNTSDLPRDLLCGISWVSRWHPVTLHAISAELTRGKYACSKISGYPQYLQCGNKHMSRSCSNVAYDLRWSEAWQVNI